ncbi:MAG: riboflavin synthase, partial [Candidatus Latescibacteria bacterium]|nr:riboflavin synthase [Candidatus Latescibacterota bacterium]
LNSQIAPKGSVALDGISLTVVDVLDDSFTIAAIPHTLAVTTWGAKPVGASVNLETDVLAKYVARALGGATQQSNITQRWLNDAGIV